VNAIYCHCALVFNCEPANSEVEDQNGTWVPVCERCMKIAWHDNRRIRILRRPIEGKPGGEAS
jgi:Zn-finger protein